MQSYVWIGATPVSAGILSAAGGSCGRTHRVIRADETDVIGARLWSSDSDHCVIDGRFTAKSLHVTPRTRRTAGPTVLAADRLHPCRQANNCHSRFTVQCNLFSLFTQANLTTSNYSQTGLQINEIFKIA